MNNLQEYSKPYFSPESLVKDYLMAIKGLNITDEELDFAEKVLSQINWYHLKIYFYPFIEDLNAADERYKAGTTFQNGWSLYLLDDDLRKIIVKYTLKIELVSKSYIDQAITEFTKDPFWYLNDDFFILGKQPYYERGQISQKMDRSDADFVTHFQKKYKSPYVSYRRLPPFWMAMELITFDQFLKIIEKLNPQVFAKKGENVLDKCAEQLGAENFKQLKSWLEVVKYIRNHACHNGRLWNAKHMIPKGLNLHLEQFEERVNPHRIYLIIVVIYLMTKNKIVINGNIKNDIKELFEKYKNKVNNLEKQMGFPKDWESADIWH
jgi:abortive infection bacteriophage resistance protein